MKMEPLWCVSLFFPVVFERRDVKPENLMFRRRVRSNVASAAATRLQQQNHQQGDQQQLEVDEEEKKHLEEVERARTGVAQRVNRSSEPPLLSMEEQHELLLIDFDTSMFIDDPSGNSNDAVTPHRRLVGTYGYLAPEVLKSGCYTPASDLWSVGVILYILMTVSWSSVKSGWGVESVGRWLDMC